MDAMFFPGRRKPTSWDTILPTIWHTIWPTIWLTMWVFCSSGSFAQHLAHNLAHYPHTVLDRKLIFITVCILPKT